VATYALLQAPCTLVHEGIPTTPDAAILNSVKNTQCCILENVGPTALAQHHAWGVYSTGVHEGDWRKYDDHDNKLAEVCEILVTSRARLRGVCSCCTKLVRPTLPLQHAFLFFTKQPPTTSSLIAHPIMAWSGCRRDRFSSGGHDPSGAEEGWLVEGDREWKDWTV